MRRPRETHRALSIDQVPASLIGPFVEWVRNSSIRVVHLVREASLLRHLSSDKAHRTKIYTTHSQAIPNPNPCNSDSY